MEADARQAASRERSKAVVVLQAPELALNRHMAPIEIREPLSVATEATFPQTRLAADAERDRDDRYDVLLLRRGVADAVVADLARVPRHDLVDPE